MDFKIRVIIYVLLIGALIIILLMSGFSYEQIFVLIPELMEENEQDPTADFILRVLRVILTVILIIGAILEVIFKVKKINSLEQEDQSGKRRKRGYKK